MENKIKICHLYPDLLNLYGDTGNIICLKKRLEDRGYAVEVTGISAGDRLRDEYDIYFIGGGQDFEQEVLLKDLLGEKTSVIKDAVENEKVFLAICGGYQMLGQYYRTWDGHQLDFTGALDLYTVGEKERLIGNYMYELPEEYGKIKVVGFENHSGKTYLSEGISPLGTVLSGNGNNGKDKTEGVHYKNVFGTYSHGPVLPKNPGFADLLLSEALKRKGMSGELQPLSDELENMAHDYMVERLSK